jgi:hypothetical protein
MISAVNLGRLNADPQEREARLKRWEAQILVLAYFPEHQTSTARRIFSIHSATALSNFSRAVSVRLSYSTTPERSRHLRYSPSPLVPSRSP